MIYLKVIIGLGNPGNEYKNTRHNVGFMFLDYYLNKTNIMDNWKSKFNALYLKTKIFDDDVIFVKPQTYMNLSGKAVKAVVDFFKVTVDDIFVISDDLDLNIGNFKLKLSGSCGGHNGLRSIEECINSKNYKRLKIGISNNKELDTKDYVLGSFSKNDIEVLNDLFSSLCLVLDDYFKIPFPDLMNKYNRKNK